MSALIERIEDASEVVIGRRYNVPLVRWVGQDFMHRPSSYPPSIPINGPLHEDREIIKFDDEHWHIDWRFVGVSYWENIWSWRDADSRDFIAAGKVLSAKNTDGVVRRGVRTCRRLQIAYPSSETQPRVPWLAELEAKYAKSVARCNVCPHRGISLVGANVESGARVCPGHGLAWDLKTGELKKRTRTQTTLGLPI